MKTCEHCGEDFTPRYPYAPRPNRFCSVVCYHASGFRGPRLAKVKQQRMRTVASHPLAPPSGVVAVSRLVLYEKIGPGTHPCHWCGTPVTWMPGAGLAKGALVADHLNWDKNNDSPENLVPSCNVCNRHRTHDGKKMLLRDDELSVVWSGERTRAVERVCGTCGETFLIPPSATKKGRGRYCSRACMYARNR